jgi:hypothetical protein
VRRKTTLALIAASAVAAAPATVAVAPASAKQRARFTVRMKTPHHQPKANKKWRITVTATRHGKRLRATAYYEFYFEGQRVSKQYPSPGKPPGTAHKPYHFKGKYHDDLLFPKRSVGIPLTLRVVVKVKGLGTAHADKKVRVRR